MIKGFIDDTLDSDLWNDRLFAVKAVISIFRNNNTTKNKYELNICIPLGDKNWERYYFDSFFKTAKRGIEFLRLNFKSEFTVPLMRLTALMSEED